MSNNRLSHNNEFQRLARQIKSQINKNGGIVGNTEQQREQVSRLYSLEVRFKNSIQKHKQAYNIYNDFIQFIKQNNILNARVYFRERKKIFDSRIAKAIKKENIEEVMSFDINYKLIKFIVDSWKGKLPRWPSNHYANLVKIRTEIIENNLPLAIHQAKSFYRRTPISQITLLDMIDICTLGLINGVDKYVGEYSKVWRSVCIGHMVVNLIEQYSQTFLRLYPADKKILYRANSLKHKYQVENIEDLTKLINESFLEDKRNKKPVPKLPIPEIYILTLLNGTSYTPVEQQVGDENSIDIYNIFPSEYSLEEDIIKKDLMSQIRICSKYLTILERKIIKLKGVAL